MIPFTYTMAKISVSSFLSFKFYAFTLWWCCEHHSLVFFVQSSESDEFANILDTNKYLSSLISPNVGVHIFLCEKLPVKFLSKVPT